MFPNAPNIDQHAPEINPKWVQNRSSGVVYGGHGAAVSVPECISWMLLLRCVGSPFWPKLVLQGWILGASESEGVPQSSCERSLVAAFGGSSLEGGRRPEALSNTLRGLLDVRLREPSRGFGISRLPDLFKPTRVRDLHAYVYIYIYIYICINAEYTKYI